MSKRSVAIALLIGLFSLFSSGVLGQELYPKGAGALEIFDGEAFLAAPLPAKLWLVFLASMFLVGLIAYAWKRPIARWAGGGFFVSILTGHLVFAALGLPMLGGSIALWHIVCWTPALVLLLAKRPFLNREEDRWFRIWSALMTFAIIVSFVFDVRDANIYVNHFWANS